MPRDIRKRHDEMIKKQDDMIKNNADDPAAITWERISPEKTPRVKVRLQKYDVAADGWHRHEGFWELVLVVSGTAVNETEDGRIRLGKGDLFVMPPGSVHHYRNMDNFRHYTVFFRPEAFSSFPENFDSLPSFRILFHGENSCSPLLHINGNDIYEAMEKIEDAGREYLNRRAGWMEAVCAEAFRALIALLRYASPIEHQTDPTLFQIRKTIRYMEENLTRVLTLHSLSLVARMSVSNFRLRFREFTGFPPIDYLIRLRLRQAAILMAYTDQPLSEVLEQTGFSDSSYFGRQFRRIFGMTARRFRRDARSGAIHPEEEYRNIMLRPAPRQRP